jgi:hypothetical protein
MSESCVDYCASLLESLGDSRRSHNRCHVGAADEPTLPEMILCMIDSAEGADH